MTPAQVKATYRRLLDAHGETVYLRRYSGSGEARVATDYAVKARVIDFQPAELIGGIVQGDRNLIVSADDVANSGITLPIVATADKMLVRGRELAIKAVDDSTRRTAGELMAYEIVAGG